MSTAIPLPTEHEPFLPFEFRKEAPTAAQACKEFDRILLRMTILIEAGSSLLDSQRENGIEVSAIEMLELLDLLREQARTGSDISARVKQMPSDGRPE